ncbi:unnamed protein product [Hyaloperonospora brassicae]|uniref:Histone-lysine N-methyltransferase NSD-like PHD zinc finger domain-containing protein n=1 Tax=Hyaloperonospora brassicae TaxID=162125 RepID=A0AAV0UH31_HYABA|nr:unnamed protein product [Hyaloperonospora brassicae]
MRKCVVRDCGRHFHAHCRRPQPTPDELQPEQKRAFVCPRHTCETCGSLETDMKQCRSCSVCSHMTHLCCPRAGARSSSSSSSNSSSSLSLTGSSSSTAEPASSSSSLHLFECPRHDRNETPSTFAALSSPDASNSLRMRLAAGDAVLVLEFDNALLPSSVKTAAPDVANHWGVVISAEETEPRGCGNQLLNVRMFADDNVLVVPNQYALRTATASDFARPVDFVRHCLQRHVMVELQLRCLENHVDDSEAKRIVQASNAAFAACLNALGVTAAQATSDAEQGLVRWRQFLTLAEPRRYDGLGDVAPSYLYIDTRKSRPGQQASMSVNGTGVAADVDRNLSMNGNADAQSSGPAANGSSCGTLHPRRPRSVGRSPHEAEAEQATDAMPSDAHPVPSPPGGSTVIQDHTSTVDATSATKQDAQPTNGSQSGAHACLGVTRSQSVSAHMNSGNGSIAGSAANNNAQTTDDAQRLASAKRRKLETKTPMWTSTADCAPIDIHRIRSGGSRTTASTSDTSRISPVASTVRTLHRQKRRLLTRRQKLLAETPPPVLAELKRVALRYLEEADRSRPVVARIPSDVDAFPWAARASSFRPAFYRPSVMLGHSGLRRSRFNAVSRLLVSQNKRDIKCFVQTLETDAQMSGSSDSRRKPSSAPPGFVLLDLLSMRSFRELESVVRARLVETLMPHSHCTDEYLGMNVYQSQRWVEQQQRHRTPRDDLPISLTYCTIDGVRHRLDLRKSPSRPSAKDARTWLSFCANVCHLAAVITIPCADRSVPASTTISLQHSAVAK